MRREVKSSQSTQMRNCKQVGDQRTCVGRWLAYAKRHFSMLILPRSELPRVSPDLLCHGLDAFFPGHACRGHDHGHALSAETCHGHDFCNRTLELMNRCNDSCSFIRRALEARWIVKHESVINSKNKGRKWLSQSPSRSILVPRGRAPTGQREESRPLERSNFWSMHRVIVSYRPFAGSGHISGTE